MAVAAPPVAQGLAYGPGYSVTVLDTEEFWYDLGRDPFPFTIEEFSERYIKPAVEDLWTNP